MWFQLQGHQEYLFEAMLFKGWCSLVKEAKDLKKCLRMITLGVLMSILYR